MQQVINSLGVQRLKLFGKLKQSTLHLSDDCCKSNLSKYELECLNGSFENSSNLSEVERASVYYISGYVAPKEKCMSLDTLDIVSKNDSEFTQMVSRGKLNFPREDLFDLSLYFYGYYKIVIDEKCINRLLTAF